MYHMSLLYLLRSETVPPPPHLGPSRVHCSSAVQSPQQENQARRGEIREDATARSGLALYHESCEGTAPASL